MMLSAAFTTAFLLVLKVFAISPGGEAISNFSFPNFTHPCLGMTTSASDTNSLIALYSACVGEYWVWDSYSEKIPWNLTSANPCGDNWQGINCTVETTECVVTAIELVYFNLTGTLPFELALMDSLEYLILDKNELYDHLPLNIYNMTNLQHLSVGYNKMSGKLTDSLYEMSSLIYFSVFDNYITGSVPPYVLLSDKLIYFNVGENAMTGPLPIIGPDCPAVFLDFADNYFASVLSDSNLANLTEIEYLRLDSNYLRGTIPDTFGNMQSLAVLSLSNNHLSGSIPPSMAKFSSISHFSIAFNLITGELPMYFGRLTTLTHFDLSHNLLGNSSIPPEFGNLCKLIEFNIGANKNIEGSIPDTFIALTKLRTFTLDINRITGNIPEFIGRNWTLLSSLDISSNRLFGSIPESIYFLTLMEYFTIADNELTGTISSMVSSFVNCTYLSIGDNNLNGTVPEVLFNLTNLVTLAYQSNDLSGTLSSNIANLQKLTDAILHYNNFHGTVPTEVGLMTNLNAFDIEYNNFDGYLPTELGSMSRLIGLFLSHNPFVGYIPTSLGKLRLLQQIELYSTAMSGSIPDAVCSMTSLVTFSFSVSSFTGQIPSCLGNLKFLNSLYIDQCLLTGPIPNLQPMQFLVEVNMSGNMLSGSFPTSLCDLTSISYVDVAGNNLHGIFPECFQYATALQGILLDTNQFSGSISSTIGIYSHIAIFQLFENFFTGTFPTTVVNMVKLTSLLLQYNQFVGDASPIFLGNLTAIEIIDISENSFSGPVPPIGQGGLMQKLELVHIIGNCFTGTLPETMCLLRSVTGYIMDGLSAGRTCSKKVLAAYTATNLIEGDIPSCLFHMPKLNKLHLSGNGIEASLYDIGNSSGLIDLDLSYNRLTSSIPATIQQFTQFTNLDLSNNHFSGTLNDMGNLIVNQDDATVTHAATQLSLANNRLSGNLPPNFQQASVISVLQGNLFDCKNSKALPSNDPYSAGYFCGSYALVTAITTPLYIFLILFFAFLLISAYMFKPKGGVFGAMKRTLSHSWRLLVNLYSWNHKNGFDVRIPAVYANVGQSSLMNTNVVFVVLSELCRIMTVTAVVILVILMPLYLILKYAENHNYSTHTFQYGWTVSGAYISGKEPAYILITIIGCMVLSLTIYQYYFDHTVLSYTEMEVRETNASITDGGGLRSRTATHGHIVHSGVDPSRSDQSESNPSDNYGNNRNTNRITNKQLPVLRASVATRRSVSIFATAGLSGVPGMGPNRNSVTGHSATMVNGSLTEKLNVQDQGYISSAPAPDLGFGYTSEYTPPTLDIPNGNTEESILLSDKDIATDTSEYSPTLRLCINIIIRVAMYIINIIIVLIINILYVTLERSSTLFVRLFSIFMVALFKSVWNTMIVPHLVTGMLGVPSKWTTTDKEFVIGCTLQYVCIISNVLLIPCIAIAVANSDCLLLLVDPPQPVDAVLTYPECSFTIAKDHNLTIPSLPERFPDLVVEPGHNVCVQYTEIQYIEPFTPPFSYSYECSSALISAYTPAYVVQYLFSGVIVPMFEIMAWHLIRHYLRTKRNQANIQNNQLPGHTSVDVNLSSDTNSVNADGALPLVHGFCAIDFVRMCTCGLVGNWFWPVAEIIKQKLSKTNEHGVLCVDATKKLGRFSPCRNRMFNIIGAIAVMLSFGVLYPPLAVIIVVYITAISAHTLYLIQSHVDECAVVEARVKSVYSYPTGAFQRQVLCDWLEKDCFLLHTVYTQSYYCVLICSSLFYSLYFFDISDGNTALALVLLVACVALCFISYIYWRNERFDRPITVLYPNQDKETGSRVSIFDRFARSSTISNLWPVRMSHATNSVSAHSHSQFVVNNPMNSHHSHSGINGGVVVNSGSVAARDSIVSVHSVQKIGVNHDEL